MKNLIGKEDMLLNQRNKQSLPSEFYDADYYLRGIETGKSCYQNYRWLPELTMPMVMRIIDYLHIRPDQTILDYGCFPAGVKILMGNKNYKNIEEICVGEEITTSKGSIKRVLSASKRKVKKTIIIHLSHKMKIESSLEHPFLCQKREEVLCRPSGWNGTCNTNHPKGCSKCHKKGKYDSPYFVNAEDLKPGDYLCLPRFSKKEYFIEKDDWAEFLGFYLAEGNLIYSHKHHNKPHNIGGLEFTFHIKEKNYAERIVFLSKKLGGVSTSVRECEERHTLTVLVFGKVLAEEVLRLGGQKADKKKLAPEIINTWKDSSIRKLVISWLKGDGCLFHNPINGGTVWGGCSISHDLILGMRQILLRLGIMNTLTKIKKKVDRRQAYNLTIYGRFNINKLNEKEQRTTNTSIQNRMSDDYIFVPIRKIKIKNKKTFVYNMEVQGDHTYIANDLCVHNCSLGFVVKAFRLLHRQAWGFDISKYAIDNVDPMVKPYCFTSTNLVEIPESFDYCIAKDVLEHISYECIENILKYINAKNIFAIIPLGSNDKYEAPSNDLDISHIICEQLDWWLETFAHSNWEFIHFGYRIDGIKDSYYRKYPRAHGFFFCKRR